MQVPFKVQSMSHSRHQDVVSATVATYLAEGWMAADDSKTSKTDFMMSVFIDFTMAGASSGFFKYNARTLVFSSDSSSCCTLPTLYTSMIASEVKMPLLIISSILASSLAKKVSL